MDFRYYVAFIAEWLGAVGVTWLLSLSPRFQQPKVGFKYARRDGITALSLFALILLFAFIFYSILNPPSYPATLRPAPAPVSDLTQALFVAGVSLLAFVTALIIRKQPVRAIGWNPALTRVGLQVGVAVGLLTIFLRNRVIDVLRGLSTEQLTLLLLALGIALAEETIFRGYIQLRLSWWLGEWPGLIFSALMFTLWHTPAWIGHLPTNTLLILAALTFVQGLVLGWVMRKSGHVLAPALYRAISIWMQFFG